MRNQTILAALTATTIVLFLASEAKAWGAAHVGYTHVGPNGAYHYGRTEAAGPYGAYSGAHVGGVSTYSRSSAYGPDTLPSYSSGSAYHYSTAGYGGYSAGGVRSGGFTDYSTGVYRRW